MSLRDRYEQLKDEVYDDYCDYGGKYSIYDLMDMERLVIDVFEGIRSGELDAAVNNLRKKYDQIKESLDIIEFGEEDA